MFMYENEKKKLKNPRQFLVKTMKNWQFEVEHLKAKFANKNAR